MLAFVKAFVLLTRAYSHCVHIPAAEPVPSLSLAEEVRADFPALKQEAYPGKPLVYLDSAATSQKPRQVRFSPADVKSNVPPSHVQHCRLVIGEVDGIPSS